MKIKYVFSGVLLAFVLGITFSLLIPISGISKPQVPIFFGQITSSLSITILTAYAIIRYKALDIQTVIHKTVMWAATSSIVILPIYVFVRLNRGSITTLEPGGVTLVIGIVLLFYTAYLKYFQPYIDHLFQRKKYNMQAVIKEFTDDLVVLKGLNDLVSKIIRTVTDILYVERSSLLLYDDNSKNLVSARTIDQRISIPADSPFISWLSDYDRIVEREQIKADPQFEDIRETAGRYFKNVDAKVCIPLVYNKKILGIVNLSEKKNLKPYSDMDIGLLSSIKNEATIAIANSILFDRVERQNIKLKELDRLKSEFLANTSHELRTPINGIIGLVESVLDGADGPINEKAQHHLMMVNECAGNLKNLVDNLLDLTQVMVGQAEFKMKMFNLKSLLNLILPLGKGLVRDKDLKLTSEIAGDLPEVYADQDKIWQVIINLLGNAVKFCHQGEIKIGARLLEEKTSGGGQQVLVYVRDTGIGIKPENQEVVFEEFRQLDGAADREYGGTGLGLSITKKILAKHNCSIWVESVPGEGSTFYFTLPTTPGQVSVSETVQSESPAPTTDKFKPHLKFEPAISTETYVLKKEEKYERIEPGQEEVILVIDDNPVNIEVVRTRLELNNYQVIGVTGGEEGLKIAQEDGIDLIILDLMMPRMSGYEFCQQVRKDSPDIPIIMLTAKGSTEDLIYGLNLGANDYIAKPFNKEELVARVSALLRMSRLQNRLKQANQDLILSNESLEEKVKYRTKALESANFELQLMDKKKTEFLSVVSHELRTPLTSIKAFSEILLDDKICDDPTTVKHLEIISMESERLTRLIADLLSFSRLQLGKETFHLQKLDISRLVRQAISSITPLIKEQNLNINENIPDDLPEIVSDQDKLIQVMNNLLGNAIKFSHSQGKIQVSIQKTVDERGIMISVADNGVGIAQEDLDKIFFKFQKSNNPPKGIPPGTGLGLAISKEIIGQLGGRIWVESAVNQGSSFYFTLPVTRQA